MLRKTKNHENAYAKRLRNESQVRIPTKPCICSIRMPFWVIWGLFWCLWGALGRLQATFGSSLGDLGCPSGRLCAALAHSWGSMGTLWVSFWKAWGCFGSLRSRLGSILSGSGRVGHGFFMIFHVLRAYMSLFFRLAFSCLCRTVCWIPPFMHSVWHAVCL